MKLVAAADLHYSPASRARPAAIASAMCRAGADALVLAGDFVADGTVDLGEALALFAEYSGPKLMVAGNHDLWQQHPPFDTWTRYRDTIASTAEQHGFHYLDRAPLVVGDTGFVGGMGWYDYGFRQVGEPREGVRATPIRVSGSSTGAPRFSSVPGVDEMTGGDLSPEDYRHKGLVWQAGGGPHVAVWNDGVYLDWERSDAEMASYFAERMAEQIAQLAGRVRRLVAVTHFVPFAEFVGDDTADVKRAFAKAYLGSPLMGDVLRGTGDMAVVIFGHRHRQQVLEIDGMLAADAGIARPEERPLVLTLPD